METSGLFELISPKRYFHFIAYKSEHKYSGLSFLKDCGVLKEDMRLTNDIGDVNIIQGKFISPLYFYNGDTDYSVDGKGNAPYKYDLIVIEIKGYNNLLIGFPFRFLGKSIIEKLISDKSILKKGSFLKCNLTRLIKLDNAKAFVGTQISSTFSAVDLILPGELELASVTLDGDNPLGSVLYKDVFLKKINDDKCTVDGCALKCETYSDEENNIPKTRSSIHMDLFGNFKLYIHSSGKNIITVPLLFKLLSNFDCIAPTLANPINKIKDE